VGLMLGDNGGLPGEFGNLMPAWLGIIGTRIHRQRSLAAGANRGDVGDDLVDPTDGQANAVMSAMSGLAPGTSSGGTLGYGFGSVEGIGRRGRGAIGRIALKLKQEFFDLSFEHDDAREGRIVFTTQPQATRTFRAFERTVR
jgi:hypothetical protein